MGRRKREGGKEGGGKQMWRCIGKGKRRKRKRIPGIVDELDV